MTNRDIGSVLGYWHSVEFFNSYDLDDSLDDARARQREPVRIGADPAGGAAWRDLAGQAGELYLAPFDARAATLLIERCVASRGTARSAIEQTRDDEMAPEGLTCFAKVRLSAGGRVNVDSLSVSTLPWALGRLQTGTLESLCADTFELDVAILKDDLPALVASADGAPLDYRGLVAVVERLYAWAGYTPPDGTLAWMIAAPANERQASAPEPATGGEPGEDEAVDEKKDLPILNSFYFHDLSQAQRELEKPNPPRALTTYLASVDATKRDLDTDAGRDEILTTLRPQNGLAGRWPSAPTHFQSLMQQYALNKMKGMASGDLLAVNGPPGTGKTTLLRDLIAHLVVERATRLASFASWKDGVAGETVEAIFGKKTYKIAPLVPALTGFEIVVASTNNGAVENLSLELPQRKHLDPARAASLDYFQPVAHRYAGSHASQRWKQPEPVWGLVSAALGKRANRTRFSDIFVNRAAQPDDRPTDRFLPKHEVDFDKWDAEGAMTYWRYREKTRHTRIDFSAAQKRFRHAQTAYDAEFTRLEQLDAGLSRLEAAWPRIAALCPDAPYIDLKNAAALAERLARRAARLDEEAALTERGLGPAFLRWLFARLRRSLYARWRDTAGNAVFLRGARDDLLAMKALLDRTAVTVWDRTDLAGKDNQSRAFWQGETLNDLRNQLFAEAMVLHEAFFHEAQTNDLMFSLSNLPSRAPVGAAARKVLWQWLFMLTPVVSCTFASFRRQFGGLEPETLGWLVIDEAGQAVPQAAVGAIMRAQRVVVVGDPLQIPPVVTQSTRLLARLGEHWLEGRRARYAVQHHSVQTLADRSYPFGVRHPVDVEQFIGIPLVMHRRCDNPMFDIANAIAYKRRMLLAKKDETRSHPILGPSNWWQVGGTSDDGTKYIAAQGARVFEALLALYVDGVSGVVPSLPDAFVITPFREVKHGLIALLGDRKRWTNALLKTGLPVPPDLSAWLKKRVGTVHTFQGKESEMVFFVLGCDAERTGAIDWASSEPNLLNVAVTRAKTYLYVVGDRNLWGGKPYFETAVAMLDAHQHRHTRRLATGPAVEQVGEGRAG